MCVCVCVTERAIAVVRARRKRGWLVLVEQRVPLQRQMAPKGRASEMKRDKEKGVDIERNRDRTGEWGRERDERFLSSLGV